MTRHRALAVVLLASAVAAPVVTAALPAQAAPKRYSNCKALNADYPHGVGKPGARDKVSGSGRPVTTFTRSAALYSANTGRDRDDDGIACEKR